MKYQAFIFDMNGTMIDDMHYHIIAWYSIFYKYKAQITIEETKLKVYGKAEEMFERVFGKGKFSDAEIQQIILEKEMKYQEDFRPYLMVIDGLEPFLISAKEAGIKLAIGTAALKSNVDYVLDGLGLRKYFDAIVSAEDINNSKPDPEVFLKCAALLNVSPHRSIVFEDSPHGIEAALNGGFKAVAITSLHEKKDFARFEDLLFLINDYLSSKVYSLFT
ncbi:HAD family hydrolase [Flavobacterium sp.]|uniref:HAD family hydrolase n=1 Tax=Flavobacterium sp. TaxID=239 RepID=UPI003D1164E9